MGTAFGMDYMLEQAALPANEATPEAPAEPGWLERWRDRKPDR